MIPSTLPRRSLWVVAVLALVALLEARERRALLAEMKERLDGLLARTADVERVQMAETDRGKLEAYLDQVTVIKLEALDELTHEDLRGDRMFLIFLIQCGSLIERIQAKIACAGSVRDEPSFGAGQPAT